MKLKILKRRGVLFRERTDTEMPDQKKVGEVVPFFLEQRSIVDRMEVEEEEVTKLFEAERRYSPKARGSGWRWGMVDGGNVSKHCEFS